MVRNNLTTVYTSPFSDRVVGRYRSVSILKRPLHVAWWLIHFALTMAVYILFYEYLFWYENLIFNPFLTNSK